MNTVSITSNLFDPDAMLIAEIDMGKSSLDFLSRRVSRTATLDGGAYVVDNGYTASDADFKIVFKSLSITERAIIERIITLHSEIVICTDNGCFLGHTDNFIETPPTLRVIVKQQLNEV